MKLLFTIILALSSLSVFPDTISGYFTKLQELTDRKEWSLAEPVCEKAIGQYPDEIGFHSYYLWILRELKEFKKAFVYGEKAILKWPDNDSLKENLSYAYAFYASGLFDRQSYGEMLDPARRGLELHRNSTTLLWLGIALRFNRQTKEAFEVLHEGMLTYPDVQWFRLNLGYLLMEQAMECRDRNQFKEALSYITEALEVNPGTPDLVLWHGIILRDLKQPGEAIRVLTPYYDKPSQVQKYIRENLMWAFVEKAQSLPDPDKLTYGEEIFDKAISMLPDNIMLKCQKAVFFFRLDEKKWRQLSTETLSLIPASEQKAGGTYQMPLKGKTIVVHQGVNQGITHLGLLNGYAWDFAITDAEGNYAKNWEKKESHYIYDAPVYAAESGEVVYVYDSEPDTEPGKNRPDAPMNWIIIRHQNGEESQYCHLKKDSAKVKRGGKVVRGQQIASVGCSGEYVDFPHLHFQVNREQFSVEAGLTGIAVLRNEKLLKTTPIVPLQGDTIQTSW